MSVYTTQLRSVCETLAGRTESASYSETPAVISAARKKLFDFDYPIYDTSYKPVLENKIINHFYFREIGAETVGQFKFMLARTMNEIMPTYNGLYKSADMEFNPFYDADYYRDHAGSGSGSKQNTASGSSETSSETSGTDRSVNSGGVTKETEREETRTPNLTSTDTYNRTDAREIDTQDLETINTQNATTYNTSEQKTRALKDTTRKSDTPQGSLQNIENNTYMSEAQIVDGTGTETTTKTGTETTANTGTDTVTRSGTDTLEQTGTVQKRNTGTEATESTESVTETDTRQNTLTKTGTTSGSTSHADTGSETYEDTDHYLEHIYGKTPGRSYMEMLREYRESIINIDMMIIKELEICFMNIF